MFLCSTGNFQREAAIFSTKIHARLYLFICVDSSEWFKQKLIELDEFPAESEVQGVWIGLQGTYLHTYVNYKVAMLSMKVSIMD